ncbi:MAG: long-chain fatty acid--CoA ligase [Bacteroidales bacterium]|nr:long-chain fatty acid--CoA ligase [Bacteroidales bacterium]
MEKIEETKATRVFDILDIYSNEHADLDVAFAHKDKGEWIKYTPADYRRYSYMCAASLIDAGMQKGDKIISISQNLPHWNILDMAIAMAGLVHVPVYPTLNNNELEFIMRDCGAKMVFVSNAKLYAKVKQVVENLEEKPRIFTFTDVPEADNWTTLMIDSRSREAELKKLIEERKKEISEDDVFSLVYTSGTTGNPKGVMLSHKNILSNSYGVRPVIPAVYKQRAVSFLPLCHIYERMMNYAFQIKGISIYYAESLGTIMRDVQDVKPHIFNMVPRVAEKFYDKIVSMGKDMTPFKKHIFNWALKVGCKFDVRNNNSAFYKLRLSIARKLVFKKWQEAFGGNILVIVAGGSSLSLHISKLFAAAGLKICEGYGLTETSPVIAVNWPAWDKSMLGTVGPILDGVTVKIDDDGEILAKGPNIMKGYYNNEEATRQVIDEDGWFHTGDIGELVEGRFLKITDRKKEIFKMSNGKYIAPQVIENKLKNSNFVEQVMIIGENEKFASALISPDFNYLHFYASKHKIHYRDNVALINDPDVIKKYQGEIDNLNKTLSEYECIKRFRLVCEEWSQETGELSPTLKLKRNVIKKKYASVIDEIYMHQEEQQQQGPVNPNAIIGKITDSMKKLVNIGSSKH